MITALAGVRVGHWTDSRARTGCTVVLLPEGAVASGEVRGGAPATREFALLEPSRLVQRLDAVVLCGGSAFGLAAADGVMRFCEEQGVGLPTIGGPVPIVVAMALYDLAVGQAAVRPGADQGYAACLAADGSPVPDGPVGAGAGATVGKWRGPDRVRPAGLGSGVASDGDVVVAALLVVNAFGDLDRGLGDEERRLSPPAGGAFGNTTVGVVLTNAEVDKLGCLVLAQAAHEGLSRTLWPPHTRVDGDALVVASVGGIEASLDHLRLLAIVAVERAVRAAVAAGGERTGR